MSDGFEDNSQGSHPDGHVQQVGSKEKVVVVAEQGEHEVPQLVEEGVVCDGDSRFPHLVPPVDAGDKRENATLALTAVIFNSARSGH